MMLAARIRPQSLFGIDGAPDRFAADYFINSQKISITCLRFLFEVKIKLKSLD